MNQHTRDLQAQLTRYKELKGLSFEELGASFGYSATALCRYLKGDFNGDLAKLEKALFDGLRAAEERERAAAGLFDSNPANVIRTVANKLRRNHWMGAVDGDAGVGKTCGANKLLLANLSAWFMTVCVYRRDKNALGKAMWEQMGNGTRGCNRMEYMEEAAEGSGRILIVDQAHLLNKMGRQFFCDFHDRTGLAILFIGNPEMFDDWKESPQQYTRLKIRESATLRPNVCETVNGHNSGFSATRAAMDMLKKLGVPKEAWEPLRDRAETVASGNGHLRALETTLLLAGPIVEATGCTWPEAFDAAETQQVRNFGK